MKFKIGENIYNCQKVIKFAYLDEYKRVVKKIFFKNVEGVDDEFIINFYSNLSEDTTLIEYENVQKKVQTANITMVRDYTIGIEVIEEIVNVQ